MVNLKIYGLLSPLTITSQVTLSTPYTITLHKQIIAISFLKDTNFRSLLGPLAIEQSSTRLQILLSQNDFYYTLWVCFTFYVFLPASETALREVIGCSDTNKWYILNIYDNSSFFWSLFCLFLLSFCHLFAVFVAFLMRPHQVFVVFRLFTQ